jgi:hypothetical protein
MVKFQTLTLFLSIGYAIAGALDSHPGSLPTRRDVSKARAKGLRLVKTSDDDAGVWMTEQEKFDTLVSKKIGFMDITDTLVRHGQFNLYGDMTDRDFRSLRTFTLTALLMRRSQSKLSRRFPRISLKRNH